MNIKDLNPKDYTIVNKPLNINDLPKNSYSVVNSSLTTSQNSQTTPQLEQTNEYKPLFKTKEGEAILSRGSKVIGNLLPSAWNFAKGAVNFLNPINTIKNLKSQAEQIGSDINAPKVSAIDVVKEIPETAYKMLVPESLQDIFKGKFEQASQKIAEDPVGQIAPFLMLGEGGAKALGKTSEFEGAISKIAKPITQPISKVASKGTELGKNLTTSAASYVTGLDKATIQNIVNNPEAFSKIARDNVDRGGLAGEVKTAIDTRLKDLSETGKGYENLRKANPHPELEINVTKIPENTISDVLKKYNIELVDGKIKTGVESTPLSPTDVSKLQHFVDTYGNETKLSNNAFLNARSALSDLSKYEQGATGRLNIIARDLRTAYDTQGKSQIPGLKELDAIYAPEVSFLKQIKKDYLNKDGTFKDNAINKIANSTGAGKENLLNRLENVMPGITKRVQILKAVEDIEKSNGIKAYQYSKLATKIAVGAGGYALGGITGTIIAEIIANPSIAVPLLRGYGYTSEQLLPILKTLKDFAGDINNLKTPESVKQYLKNPKLGASIEDVSKNQEIISPKTPETIKPNANANSNSINKSIPLKPSKVNTENSIPFPEPKTMNELALNAKKIYSDNPKISNALDLISRYKNGELNAEHIWGVLSSKDSPFSVAQSHTIYEALGIDPMGGFPFKKLPYKISPEKLAEKIKTNLFKDKYGFELTDNEIKKLGVDQNKIVKLLDTISPENRLISEAKKYKSADEFVKAQPTAYHFTSPETKITKWSTKKSMGRIWFTDNPSVGENVGASGKGKMYTVRFDKNAKWATPEQADKSFTDQLIAEGYDGVYHPDSSGKYGNYYEVFNPKVIKTKSQLIDIWKKANKK